jgi:Flp pilus assembly protein protease CpaA
MHGVPFPSRGFYLAYAGLLLLLLAWASWHDLRRRTIPRWLPVMLLILGLPAPG